uniref:Uncharacterized protein n=1 Tax=Plectus sambesii TaxID=2011161 RepID=A0A914UIF2_9BILA
MPSSSTVVIARRRCNRLSRRSGCTVKPKRLERDQMHKVGPKVFLEKQIDEQPKGRITIKNDEKEITGKTGRQAKDAQIKSPKNEHGTRDQDSRKAGDGYNGSDTFHLSSHLGSSRSSKTRLFPGRLECGYG